MPPARKITIEVPNDLLRRAQTSTGAGVTTTVRRGLELIVAMGAYDDLRKLRGRVPTSIEVDKLRKDRR